MSEGLQLPVVEDGGLVIPDAVQSRVKYSAKLCRSTLSQGGASSAFSSP